MKTFHDLSIKAKLFFLLCLLSIPLVYFTTRLLWQEYQATQVLSRSRQNLEEVQLITDLLQEMESEWISGFDHFLSSNPTLLQKLNSEITKTNTTFQKLVKFGRLTNNQVSETLIINNLELIRGDFRSNDSGKNILQIRESFNQITNLLINEIDDSGKQAENKVVKQRINEIFHISSAKEQHASIRFLIKSLLLSETNQTSKLAKLQAASDLFDYHISKFKSSISSDELEIFHNVFSGIAVDQFIGTKNEILSKSSLNTVLYSTEEWTDISINGFDKLFEFETTFIDEVILEVESMISKSKTRFNLILVTSILVFGLTLLFAFYLTRYIANNLIKLTKSAERISRGEIEISPLRTSNDELGRLSLSFNALIQNAQNLSNAALAIGNGDYETTIQVRGDQDRLGKALVQMRENLLKLSLENRKRTWLLSGNSELNDTIRGDKEPKQLAEDVITQICNYLQANIGAIYLYEAGNFSLFGSFAYIPKSSENNQFELGEGLLGQVALEKKPIIINDIPSNYIKIKSGLGNAIPNNLLLYPIIFDEQVLGVVELGTLKSFGEEELQLMLMIGENLGIAFNSAFSREKMRDLLEETQRQAEELETQQEELRQTNEELTEKTEMLLRSEAELKTQQEELQQTNEELEEKANLLQEQKERLENATNELETKARELEITSKYKSEFLANMSHELRTPLNSILILSQLMAENKNNQLAEKEVEFAKNIYSSGTDLLSLINEILDLSKVEAGKMELDIEQIDISEISRDLKTMFVEVAQSKNINFEIKESLIDIHSVQTDRLRLNQILRNLLSNAFKFTPKGGNVAIEISQTRGAQKFRNKKLQKCKNAFVFKIKDNGIGIPAEKLGIIFEAFQQADGSTKRQYGGTGLGLSISRELASALGGEIEVESISGTGSIFTLYLPENFMQTEDLQNVDSPSFEKSNRTQDSQNQLASLPTLDEKEHNIEDDRETIKKEDRVILIMEDDPIFAETLLEFVRSRGFKGIIATQANKGVSYALKFMPMAILLDLKLPDISGEEVLKMLKNSPELRHIPVQIISGQDKKIETLTAGAFDFLKKPVDLPSLQKAFDKIEDFYKRKVKKLLIVEDNSNQNSAIQSLMEDHDIEIHTAFTGAEALQHFDNHRFDCMIIDLGLPDISGIELIEQIRKKHTINQTPIIVYTGKELNKEEHQTLLKLANKIVIKTVESNERLLDETKLFLHRVESKLPKEKQVAFRTLHKNDEILKGKHVLVVDDDIRNIYSLTNLLEEEGVICHTAENGKVAVDMLAQLKDVDLILMDIMMPEMDGYEATKAIKSLPKYSKIPIIALTAKAMKGDREKCLNAGMSDYISKPIDIDQLLSLMRVWLYK
ncbi:Signal transduction histidine kinase [Belliella buryatensis]|uniref:histidine kinase n=1 Tax=Belliella buryatensis TaxID=1500549 RepID=A0A239GQ46_9BACT|nr:response regulator [Belliella buryatensis]SNS70204.1 Signal transduction histidine kinase [Belliella buryatensis]